MTEKKLYRTATKCIKETMGKLKDEEHFLSQELSTITHIIENALGGRLRHLTQGPLPFSTREENILLVVDFLKEINSELATRLLNDYKEGKIIISPSQTEDYTTVNFETGEYTVHIKEKNTLDDALSLVHEYFHTLNINDSAYRKAFTESISITAEFLFLDFLKERGFSLYDICLVSNRRNEIYGLNTTFLKKLLPLYLDVVKRGTLTSDTFRRNAHHFHGKSDFNDFIDNEIVLSNNKIEHITSYKHTLGYICGSVFHQMGHTRKELLQANDSLRTADIEQFNLLLGYHIFMSDSPMYVRKELNHFKPKTYIKPFQ